MQTLRGDGGAADVKSHCQQKQGTARKKHGEYSGDDDSERKRNLDPANPSILALLSMPSCGMVDLIMVPAQAGDRNQVHGLLQRHVAAHPGVRSKEKNKRKSRRKARRSLDEDKPSNAC